jgi:hypothetical protein
MMERDQMQEILSEQGFQQSGACTDEACMVELGQVLGVERLISGSIGKLGSMFLLNFRAIDVQTAKIIKVVSKDIPGGIEDVVMLLPDIARQLVGEAGTKAPVQETTPVVSAPVVVKEEPAPVVEAPVVDGPKEAVPESDGNTKNKNRAGVRISYNRFFGDLRGRYFKDPGDDDYVDITDWWQGKEYYDSLEMEDGYSSVYYKSVLSRLQVNFMIKAGPFIVIDVGPGLMIWNNTSGYTREYYDMNSGFVTQTDAWEFKIFSPNISLGLNFVKRFYPLKINIGFLVDINFNIIRTREETTSSVVYYNTPDFNDIDFCVNTSFGPRAGLEIMGGEHFGFNVDFLTRWSTIKSDIRFYEGDYSQWKFELPLFGVGAGINFYY